MSADKSSSPGLFRRFYRVFRWVALGVSLLVILLILRRSPPPQVDTDPQAAERLQAALAEMAQARAAHQPHNLRLPEAELNSWVSSTLALAPAPAQPAPAPAPGTQPAAEPTLEEVRSTVRDLKLDLVDDRIRAYVLFDFHGADLSLLLEGRIRAEAGYIRFEPLSGKLGSLPLPQGALDRAVARLFDSPENKEQFRLPPEITDIRVENSALVVSYR